MIDEFRGELPGKCIDTKKIGLTNGNVNKLEFEDDLL